MKILNGSELAGFIKERQAAMVRAMDRVPKLLIIRDSDNPVIKKYVDLKKRYGDDIGVHVEDFKASSVAEIQGRIAEANADVDIDGIIVQLPIADVDMTDEVVKMIAPSKDVDGLSGTGDYDSATATAILWLLSGYDIELASKRIAIVGRGRLVGMPLYKMFTDSGLDVSLFHRGDDLNMLRDYDVIITATGVPGLIKSEMVAPGAVVVDAGTASEDGALVGDVDIAVRKRTDLTAITPLVGGVGPLTISCLFEHVIG